MLSEQNGTGVVHVPEASATAVGTHLKEGQGPDHTDDPDTIG